jgi:tRNA (guanine37-N1)-methyltransferase
MKGPGIRVPRTRGEETRRNLAEKGWLRTDLEILKEEGFLVLPLAGAPDSSLPGELVTREFASVRSSTPSDYRDLLAWAPDVRQQLPRSFDVVGDIVLVRLPEQFLERRYEIGEALLRFVPGTRIVGRDLGVHGPERLRTVERIAGAGDWRTRHRENGLEFDVDVERAYFSPRLAREHARVAAEVEPGERVYDLCCGVGPFAVTIARDGRASSVTAVDSNPGAVALLRKTLARYALESRVRAVESPLETFLPSAAPVERAVLNLPHEGIKYLSSVAPTIGPRGHLHYYEMTPRAEVEMRAERIVTLLGSEAWTCVDQHVVHPYSPTSDVMAFVLERSGR